MKVESLALFIAEGSRLESRLLGLMDKLHGCVDQYTYEEIEEQVRRIGEAIRELRGLLVKVKVAVQ